MDVRTRRRINTAIAALPTEPIRDGDLSKVGLAHAAVAAMFEAEGERHDAAKWLDRGAQFAADSGHLVRAIALVNRASKLEASDVRSRRAREWTHRLETLSLLG